MTTTDMTPPPPPPFAPPPPPPAPGPDGHSQRTVRRSRSDRLGAGVAGGLGEYFAIDPVLFRVLFATAAFFGGAGILAYLIAWAVIPEEGTERAAIDGWVGKLRARRVPFWAIVGAAAVLLYLVAFSWWAPGPFVPVVFVVIVLVAAFGRQGRRQAAPAAPTVSLEKDTPPAAGRPSWVADARAWVAESREASRTRARRALPVKIATLLTLVGTLVTLGLIDAAHGIAVPLYFWFGLGIVGLGLMIGIVLRRTPWSMTWLLVLSVLGLVAFGGSRASLHDGVGQRDWTPTTSVQSHYDLAFGRSTLDLRSVRSLTDGQVVRIEQAAGEVRIIAPRSMQLTVRANVHFGVVTVDGETARDADGGAAVTRTVEPSATATGPALTIDVHLTDGRVDIERV